MGNLTFTHIWADGLTIAGIGGCTRGRASIGAKEPPAC